MKKAIHLILCCVCLLMNIRVAYGEVVKRDTLVEDFSAADIAKYKNYTTHAVWTAKNGITWHCENMAVRTGTLLTSTGVVFTSNTSRTSGFLRTGKIRRLHKLSFDIGRKNAIQLLVSYSTDGINWSKYDTFDIPTTKTSTNTIEFPETADYYVRFSVGATTSGAYFYLDNITFYTEQTKTGEQMDIVDWGKNSLTLNMNGCAPEMGVSVSIDGGEEKTIEEGKAYSYLGQNDRTYRVETQNLRAGDDVQIVAKYGDSQGNTYASNRKYRVPYIYDDSVVWKFSYMTDDDIVVRGGKTVLQTDVAVRNVYVYPDGELVVADKCTLTCAKLFVRTTATESGAVSGKIQAHETYYTRIVANRTKYFQFALPVQSTTNNIQTTAGDICVLDKHWRLNTYDTQLRAEQGNIADNWVRYTGETIEAHKGYAMLSASAYYREYLFPVVYAETEAEKQVAVTAPQGVVDAAHNGWNYICSPYADKYISVLADDPTERVYVSELRKDGSGYRQHVADTIYPARPFYYQAAEAGNLIFGESLHFEAGIAQTVAAHIQTAKPVTTQWLQLVIRDTTNQTDEANICTHPTKFATAYETGKDLLKLHGNGQHIELYSLMPCGELSFNALPDSLTATGVRLGYHAAQAGTYTLRLTPNGYLERVAQVWLTDKQSNTRTDLLLQDYSFTTQAGEHQDRFAVYCVFRTQETPTGMHPIGDAAGVAQKILLDGAIYVVRHGEWFDLLGRRR